MEAKIIEAAVFEKLADEVEKRVSRKYEIRLQKLESKYEKRFRQLKQYICQLEQKLTRTSRQNDDTRGRQKKNRSPCNDPQMTFALRNKRFVHMRSLGLVLCPSFPPRVSLCVPFCCSCSRSRKSTNIDRWRENS